MRLHKEILTKEQIELLPLIREFGNDFFLVGGTAIALHIGHRHSIDFDLFCPNDFDNKKIKRKIRRRFKVDATYVDEQGQYTLNINSAKITFYNYPYKIKTPARLDKIIAMPDLLTLAAMKAFALGGRAKWKDYVDLYFIMKGYYSLGEISKKGNEIFGNEFNERIFREALTYFKDIDRQEKIIYLKGFETSDKTITKKLIDFSLS